MTSFTLNEYDDDDDDDDDVTSVIVSYPIHIFVWLMPGPVCE